MPGRPQVLDLFQERLPLRDDLVPVLFGKPFKTHLEDCVRLDCVEASSPSGLGGLTPVSRRPDEGYDRVQVVYSDDQAARMCALSSALRNS